MRDFQDSFETREQSFTSAFSICMTVPLNAGLDVSWYLWQNVRIRTFDAIVVTIKVAMIKLHYVLKLKKNRKWHLLFLILLFLWILRLAWIQSSYLLLSYLRNQACMSYYINYFLNNVLVNLCENSKVRLSSSIFQRK